MSLWGRCAALGTLAARRKRCAEERRGIWVCGCGWGGLRFGILGARCAALHAFLGLPPHVLLELQRLRGMCQ